VGQMLLGFMLPFALAFVAIPLESLIHSSRTVGGMLLAGAIRAASFALRLAGSVVRQMSRVLVNLYDVAIVLPLLAERLVKTVPHKSKKKMKNEIDVDDAERTHA
jgi:hypothetical protein